jgi:hypothetical protein
MLTELDSLQVGQRFSSGKAATKYVKDYCLKNNKSARVASTSGRSKTYECPTDGCDWLVVVTRERHDPLDFVSP